MESLTHTKKKLHFLYPSLNPTFSKIFHIRYPTYCNKQIQLAIG
jgi:hypothetical protein